ncbi:helix-turn-helix domain-containing protein [Streptomyces sp. NPDC057638]|uniref:AraC-like ligand-binding domain-containing protein n=1 Tax=Streptomyces sp. NPDC057638 TaxID=3346190 RepID=UPI00369F03E8
MWSWVSSRDVPPGERADWYHDIVSRAVVTNRLALGDPAVFHATAGVLELGRMEVSRFSYSALRSWRTPAMIRQGDPGDYFLGLITGGSMGISQCRNDTRVGPGEAVLFDTTHPYHAGTASPDGASFYLLRIPRAVLPLPSDTVEEGVARRLDGRSGMGAVLWEFAKTLETHAGACDQRELDLLESTALALASGFLARRLDAWDALPEPTRAQVLLERIDAFIDRHLPDPALTPRVVADHHHISLRTLYLLFERRGEGVAASIRRRRLERCRTDLSRVELSARPIHAVAARWGLTSPTGFGRAFRHTYGISPREFRDQVLRAQAGEER